MLNDYFVCLSSFSYFYNKVFYGPRWFLTFAALNSLFFLCPLFIKFWDGVTALIYSSTFERGYSSSITEKNPAIFPLCPGNTFNYSTNYSLYTKFNKANLYISFPYPISFIFNVYYYNLKAFKR